VTDETLKVLDYTTIAKIDDASTRFATYGETQGVSEAEANE